MYALAEYNQPCAPTLSGFYGLGAALTPDQRKAQNQAKQAANKAAALAKRTQRKAAVAAKKAARVAGRTVQTSNPAAASKINQAVQAAQTQLKNVTSLAATAKRTRNKADIQKALAAAQSAGKFIQTIKAPVTPPAAVKLLRGMGYLGACQDDGSGNYYDETGAPCDPSTYVDPTAGGGYVPPYVPPAPAYGQQPIYQGQYGTTSPYGLSPTGLVPGFGTGLPSFGQGYAPTGCRTGSNLPRCLIYQMAVDEQQQFQFVFSILQQMYAQLLQIVQQLLTQLQSAQQAPYGYGQQPYSPYGQSPYSPYTDPNNPYGAAYGGQYPGPGYPGVPYYPGGADSSAIPPGYGDAGGDPFGAGGAIPGDVTQVFPGPGPMAAGPIPQGPSQPTNIISSDSLPDGADAQDSFGGGDGGGSFVPAYTPAPQSMQPIPVQSQASGQSVTSGPTTPTVIVLQQGPGQSSYADTGLPAGPSQDQASLEPPSTGVEDWARES